MFLNASHRLHWFLFFYWLAINAIISTSTAPSQNLPRSIVDPGRILQHQGRHPECDDWSAQVFGGGMSKEWVVLKKNFVLDLLVIFETIFAWVFFSSGQIPIVENEIRKETGEVKAEDEVSAAPAQKLVTEMGTYVTQSALSSSRPSKKDEDRSGQSHSCCDALALGRFHSF